LPEQGEEMLRRLGGRLREFGQTPLLLWMLCSLYKQTGNVPPNLGLVFRCFAQSYDGKIKDDVPVSGESRRWWQELLQHLAFEMMQGETRTELRVTIDKREAEAIFEKFLQGKVDYPPTRAKEWLEDLLKYHLIQLKTDDHIEFRQQLLQEYYAAECLLKQLSQISDSRLKRDYLNYLKWTEPLAMMLGLVEKESQALRVVKSALEVDLWLGAKLAGAVKPEFQAQMVNLVTSLEINQQLKSQLLAITHCQSVVPALSESLQYENSSNGANFVDGLESINPQLTIPKLLQSLTDEDSEVSSRAAYMLKRIGTPELLSQLLDILLTAKASDLLDVIYAIQERYKYYNHFIAQSHSLEEENDSISLIDILKILNRTLKAISETPKYDFHQPVIENLTLNDTGTINQTSTTMQEAPKYDFQQAVIEHLTLNEMRTVNQTSQSISKGNTQDFTKANIENIDFTNLGQLDDVVTVPALRVASKNEDAEVRKYAAQALGQIGNESAISALIQLLNDEDSKVRVSAAQALGQIGNESAISALIQLLNDEDSKVRVSAAQALGQIGNESAISALIQALKDEDSRVRVSAAQALSEVDSESTTPALIQALKDEDSKVRVSAAQALGKVGNPVAISALIQALNDEDSEVRLSAAEGLAHIQIVQNNVAETTPDIQDLLEEIFQNYPSATQVDQSVTLAKIKQAIKQNPGLKSRLTSALKSGGDEALKAIFSHPIFTIPIDIIKGWIEDNN
jgi:HEAT repeat protein